MWKVLLVVSVVSAAPAQDETARKLWGHTHWPHVHVPAHTHWPHIHVPVTLPHTHLPIGHIHVPMPTLPHIHVPMPTLPHVHLPTSIEDVTEAIVDGTETVVETVEETVDTVPHIHVPMPTLPHIHVPMPTLPHVHLPTSIEDITEAIVDGTETVVETVEEAIDTIPHVHVPLPLDPCITAGLDVPAIALLAHGMCTTYNDFWTIDHLDTGVVGASRDMFFEYVMGISFPIPEKLPGCGKIPNKYKGVNLEPAQLVCNAFKDMWDSDLFSDVLQALQAYDDVVESVEEVIDMLPHVHIPSTIEEMIDDVAESVEEVIDDILPHVHVPMPALGHIHVPLGHIHIPMW